MATSLRGQRRFLARRLGYAHLTPNLTPDEPSPPLVEPLAGPLSITVR